MCTVSFSMRKEDAEELKKYAKQHGVTTSEFMRKLAIEKLEDEEDLEAIRQWRMKKDKVTYSLEEIEKEFGL